MPIFVLWSAPRSRSTAFFRSMLERGDMVAVHEPFSDLTALGETDAQGRRFTSTASFMAAYCRSAGIPFLEHALHWEAQDRIEWHRSARWHLDVAASTEFHGRQRVYDVTVETSSDLAEAARRHEPFYNALHEARVRIG